GLALARLDVLGVDDDGRLVVDQDFHPVLDVVHAVTGHAEAPEVAKPALIATGRIRMERPPSGGATVFLTANDNRSPRQHSRKSRPHPAHRSLAGALAAGHPRTVGVAGRAGFGAGGHGSFGRGAGAVPASGTPWFRGAHAPWRPGRPAVAAGAAHQRGNAGRPRVQL